MQHLDFIAIKLGDVNQSYQSSNFNTNYISSTGFNVVTTPGFIEISPLWKELIYGFQFELDVKNLCSDFATKLESSLQNFNESNYQITGNTVRVSYASVNPFSPEFSIRIPINNENQHCQANLKLNEYFLNEVYGINTTIRIDNLYYNLAETKAEVSLYPNPISDRLFVGLKHFENTEVYRCV